MIGFREWSDLRAVDPMLEPAIGAMYIDPELYTTACTTVSLTPSDDVMRSGLKWFNNWAKWEQRVQRMINYGIRK